MKKLFVLIFFLLFFTSAPLSQAQVTPSLQTLDAPKGVSADNLPVDIQALLKKDQKTWTNEEKEKVISFLDSTRSINASSSPTSSNGATNCFDYYRFGSVQVDLASGLEQSVPGSTVGFSGEVRNENNYPLVDGQVYVKIFREGRKEFTQANGLDLIDQFPLSEIFNLPAHGSKRTSFTWKIPENAEMGEYTVAFFFQTAKRYNLLGLSFTDDVVGNQTHFSVFSNNKAGVVAFDKNTVTLNGQLHRFASFPLHFTKDEPVVAIVRLVNPKNVSVVVPVTWKLYPWDGLREDTLKDKKVESIQLKPKETKEISYTVSPIDATVSYLVANVEDGASKSILNIRFVRDGIEETRINFPSIMNYPLEKGKENTLFSCMHSTGMGLVKDNTLTLTLKDERGKTIHSYEYVGDITSAMMGVKDLFTPQKNYVTFSLTATLKHNGKVVEEVKEVYDCRNFDAGLCPKTPIIALEVVVGGVVLLLLVLGGRILITKRRLSNKNLFSFLLLFLFPILVFIVPGTVVAKSTSVTQGVPTLGFSEGSANPSGSGIANISSTVTYNAIATISGASAVEGSAVPSGSTIRITWTPNSSDISWVATGGYYDSPYGRWDSAGSKSCTTYNQCDLLNGIIYYSPPSWGIWYQGDMTVTPQTFSVSGAGISCGSTQGGGVTSGPYNAFACSFIGGSPWCDIVTTQNPYYADCVVTAPSGDPIEISVDYPSMYGYIRAGEFVGYYDSAGYVRSGGIGFNVSSASIPFSFTAAPPSSPPTTPSVVYQTPSLVNTTVIFTVTSTDADNDNIRYGFDWNTDSIVDEWVPAVGYVPSGTPQSVSRTWDIIGYKAFYVRTQDSNNNKSANSYKTINIVDTIVNGSCGPADGTTKVTTAPTSELCNTGTPSYVYNDPNYWRWDCRGINGANARCYAYKNKIPTVTIVSPSTDITINSSQSQQFSGLATDADIDGTIVAYEWRISNCTEGTLISSLISFVHSFVPGSYRVYFRAQDDSGAWSNCQSRLISVRTNAPINGVCGGANGVPVQKKPTSNLCNTVGLPGPVVLPEDIDILSESDPALSWSWTCAGEYGGADTFCGSNSSCGDGKCQASKGESPARCRADCRVNFFEF